MGLVKVSEGLLDGKVYTGTYSMPANTSFSKRDPTLEKRADIEGASCLTMCTNVPQATRPQEADCTVLYNTLYSQAEQFSVDSGTSLSLSQDYDTKLTDARLDFDTQGKRNFTYNQTVEPSLSTTRLTPSPMTIGTLGARRSGSTVTASLIRNQSSRGAHLGAISRTVPTSRSLSPFILLMGQTQPAFPSRVVHPSYFGKS